ncbi:uncharacterized protein DMAD_09968 [Drosophila madeirensis]|uniref:Uncharacterized protein n=1 Tax=Drosophila madeirensis TaxID=30013 RepID=A0AAU9F859_DROMD
MAQEERVSSQQIAPYIVKRLDTQLKAIQYPPMIHKQDVPPITDVILAVLQFHLEETFLAVCTLMELLDV